MHNETGRSVGLVGWSLGGVHAGELAKMLPDDVRQVITQGPPFTGSPEATNAWCLYQRVSGQKKGDTKRFPAVHETPPVPTTSIYSRTDGIVAWQCCVERETARSENIEVHASHMGMCTNPCVLYAIADRLAQPAGGAWERFDGQRNNSLKKLLYQ